MADHDAVQRLGSDAVGQRGGDQTADADPRYTRPVRLKSMPSVIREGTQGTDFIHAAQRTPTGQIQADTALCLSRAAVGHRPGVVMIHLSIRLAAWRRRRALLPTALASAAALGLAATLSFLTNSLTAPLRLSMRSLSDLMSSLEVFYRGGSATWRHVLENLFQLVPSFAGLAGNGVNFFLRQHACRCFRFPCLLQPRYPDFGAFCTGAGSTPNLPARLVGRFRDHRSQLFSCDAFFSRAFI